MSAGAGAKLGHAHPMHRDPDLPLVFTREQAVRYGVSANAVTWRAAHGRWRRLRRGAFCLQETYDGCSAEHRHLLTALVALAIEGRNEAMSHITAALVYGWPGPLDPVQEPWFTIESPSRVPTRRRSGVVRQRASLPVEHLWSFDSFAITSPARTVADCLRHFPPRVSLPIADAAAAEGVDVHAIRRVLDWQERWPYAGRGKQTAELIDGRRESWLESQSAVAHHELAVPPPVPQAKILDAGGRHVARVDFLWPQFGVVGEADGWGKYASTENETAPREPAVVSMTSLRLEKEREDRLRDLGYQVVRWGAADALTPYRHLRARLARAFARGDPAAVRGSFRPTVVRVESAPSCVRLAELQALTPAGLLVAAPRPYSTSIGEAV